MNVVFAAVPAYGHVYPMVPLASAFAAAGHDVTFATGQPFVGALPVPTVDAFGLSLDDAHEVVFERHPEYRDLPPDQKFLLGLELFADVITSEWMQRLPDVVEQSRSDLIIFEDTAVGAGVVAQRRGIRAAAYGISFWSMFSVSINAAVAERFGAELTAQATIADVRLDPFPPRLQREDGLALPQRMPIRPVAWTSSSGEVPSWMHERHANQPRAYITLGTVSHGALDARRIAIEAARRAGCRMLVAAGPGGELDGVAAEDVQIEEFVPQDRVLQHADVAIHHGGSGTLLGAAAAAVPQVVLPQGADQHQNAMALSASGGGIGITEGPVDTDRVSAAVGRALTDPLLRQAADDIAADIAAMPSPDEVVAALA